jgi:hypothetical protein
MVRTLFVIAMFGVLLFGLNVLLISCSKTSNPANHNTNGYNAELQNSVYGSFFVPDIPNTDSVFAASAKPHKSNQKIKALNVTTVTRAIAFRYGGNVTVNGTAMDIVTEINVTESKKSIN